MCWEFAGGERRDRDSDSLEGVVLGWSLEEGSDFVRG